MRMDTATVMVDRFLVWRGPITPFAVVTAAASAVIAASALVDLATQPSSSSGAAFAGRWTWAWCAVAVVIALAPLLLGGRYPRRLGLLGAWLFIAVTVVQLASADRPVISANNLVLYPMVACYVGWFHDRWAARGTVGVAAVASALALSANPQLGLATTWVNVTLVSAFCLGATMYLHGRLERLALTDPLTGALNRAGLEVRLEQELTRSLRTGQPLLVGVLDLDDFKLVNDTQGHAAGDRLLVELVSGLRRLSRPYDAIARLGGDEFMLLMPGVGPADGETVFARLRDRTGDIWSHGIAVSKPGDSVDTLTERADARLYRNKRARKSDSGSAR